MLSFLIIKTVFLISSWSTLLEGHKVGCFGHCSFDCWRNDGPLIHSWVWFADKLCRHVCYVKFCWYPMPLTSVCGLQNFSYAIHYKVLSLNRSNKCVDRRLCCECSALCRIDVHRTAASSSIRGMESGLRGATLLFAAISETVISSPFPIRK